MNIEFELYDIEVDVQDILRIEMRIIRGIVLVRMI